MNKLLGFVPHLLLGVVSPALGVLSSGIKKADDGVKTLAEMSGDNPKKSGFLATVLGVIGVDPTVINNAGSWLSTIGGWLQAL